MTDEFKVYVDAAGHLACRDVETLHKFAKRLGLREEWFQDHEKHPHYDLCRRIAGGKFIPSQNKIDQAITNGAEFVKSNYLYKQCFVRETE